MKIMTVNAHHAPALRSLAEDRTTLGAVALGLPPVGVLGQALGLASPFSGLAGHPLARVGSQQFALLAQVPGLPTPMPTTPTAAAPAPAAPKPGLNYIKHAELQATELEFVAREFVLPGIKAAWPNASQVITGVEIVWAAKEFWEQAADERSDSRKTVIAGVRLASKIAGLYLGATHAPSEALLTNQFAGLVIATVDKVYSAQLKALDKA